MVAEMILDDPLEGQVDFAREEIIRAIHMPSF